MKAVKYKDRSKAESMTRRELVHQLKRLMADNRGINCYKCDYSQDCGVYGCAILRKAAAVVEEGKPSTETQVVSAGGETVWTVRNLGGYCMYRCRECGSEYRVSGNTRRMAYCPECGRKASGKVTVAGGEDDG